MLNESNQSTQFDISVIWIPLISNEDSNSQRRSVCHDIFFKGFYKVLVSSVQVLLHRWP
jgi:hypothetical protein